MLGVRSQLEGLFLRSTGACRSRESSSKLLRAELSAVSGSVRLVRHAEDLEAEFVGLLERQVWVEDAGTYTRDRVGNVAGTREAADTVVVGVGYVEAEGLSPRLRALVAHEF